MKKFTKILENQNNSRFYKTTAKITLLINTENEGEAGYLSDSILSSVKECQDYTIINIEETDEKLQEGYEEDFEGTHGEVLSSTWDAEFGDRKPDMTEKMEFYHNMRKVGIDGLEVFRFMETKI